MLITHQTPSRYLKIHLKYEGLLNDSGHGKEGEQLCQGLLTQKDFGEV